MGIIQFARKEVVEALESRVQQLEATIKAMQNATNYYSNMSITNDVSIAGNVVQWDIDTQRYVPINVKGNYA